jgi:hypothetical protein
MLIARRMKFVKMEQRFARFLLRRGYEPPDPASPFEK